MQVRRSFLAAFYCTEPAFVGYLLKAGGCFGGTALPNQIAVIIVEFSPVSGSISKA